MWKLICAAIITFVLTAQGMLESSSDNNPTLVTEHTEKQAVILLKDGSIIYGLGIIVMNDAVSIKRWRASTDVEWETEPWTIPLDQVSKIDFKLIEKGQRHHGMNFFNQGWIWGGLMVIMMTAMIFGGMF